MVTRRICFSASFICFIHCSCCKNPRRSLFSSYNMYADDTQAITTGTIPGFIDVVLNFGSTALRQDNIVSQMKANGKKIVFYGDDTWINLFPGHFETFDGTTSFFVTDYTEVDNNVTRHLSSQLQPNVDWDVMILHYLGLDHIGHTSGPSSPLIRPKLAEMDAVVHRIYSAMETWEREEGIPSVLVICGDHGMSDQGGHGGSSPSEILVPLIFLSPSMKSTDSTSGGTIFQTDLCPTLAVLMGLPIPLDSVAKIITDIFVTYTLPQKMSVLHQNAQHVLRVFKTFIKNIEKESAYILYKSAFVEHKKWLDTHGSTSEEEWEHQGLRVRTLYTESLTLMAEKVGKMSSQYDLYTMMASITLLWLLLLSILATKLKKDSTMSESSLSIHLRSLVPAMGSALMTHITMCTAGSSSALMCGTTPLSIGVQLFMAGILVTSVLHLASAWGRIMSLKQLMHLGSGTSMTELFLIGATIAHTFTLLSSSFVEEEHQTFYFLTTSVHIVLLLQLGVRYVTGHQLLQEKNVKGIKQFSREEISNSNEYLQGYQSLKEEFEANAFVTHDEKEDSNVLTVDDLGVEETIKYDHLDFSNESTECSMYHDDFLNFKCDDNPKAAKEVLAYEGNADFKAGKFVLFESLDVISWKDALHACVSLAAILVLLRVSRRWNQTGNKWLDEADIGDWLVNPNNKPVLSFSVLFGLLIIGMSRSFGQHRLLNTFITLSLMTSYVFRAATGALIFPDKRFISRNGIPEARASFVFIGLTFLISLLPLHPNQDHKQETAGGSVSDIKKSKERKKLTNYRGVKRVESQDVNKRISNSNGNSSKTLMKTGLDKRDFSLQGISAIWPEVFGSNPSLPSTLNGSINRRAHIVHGIVTSWLCFMCLVLRPHNVPIIAFMSLIEQMSVHVILRLQLTPRAVLLYCLWMGHTFFFFQGNSNSITTIDLSAGYVGITDYHPSIIGLLIAFSTYSGHIFWMLSYLRIMCIMFPKNGSDSLKSVLQKSLNQLGLKMLLPLAVYCIVVSTQRYHLFVWTVFSPKLFYQGMETLILSLMAFCFWGINLVLA